jgi:hypothetical protein
MQSAEVNNTNTGETAMKTTQFHKTTLLSIVGALLLAACGGMEGDFEDPAADEVVSQQQAIGEMTCATTPLTLSGWNQDWAMVQPVRAPYCGWAGAEAASSGTSYDNSGCPDQFIVSAALPATKDALGAYGRVVDSTIAGSQAKCESTTLNLNVFGHTPKGAWIKVRSLSVRGTWSYFGCDITASANTPYSPRHPYVQVSPLTYDKVRIAVHAVYAPRYYYRKPVKVQVAGGISSMRMPCPG